MNFRIKDYLSDDNELAENLFYLSTFLTAVATGVFSSIGLLLRLGGSIISFSIASCIECILLLYFGKRFHKTKLFTYILLASTNFIAFPLMLTIAHFTIIEIPLYYLVGIVFTFVLLKGKERILFFVIEFVVDLGTLFYIQFSNKDLTYMSQLTVLNLYVRVVMAIFFCSSICGLLIFYRNLVITKEFREREAASKQAEDVSYAKDMFLVNVSHEIRTPLNAIIGTTEVIIDSNASNHIKEIACNISNSSHALLSITSDLLDFSRMNIDTIGVTKEKYDLSAMLNDIINLLNVRLLDSNVDFFVDVNPFVPKILIGDSGKIRQVIINLLSNAIKYTKEGSMTLTVDYEPSDEKNILLKFAVYDTGIGIKEENIEKIFQPLHRSGSNEVDHSIEGNGLGLALCKKLCAAMDGDIHCESEYGVGSVFYFSLKQEIDFEGNKVTCGEVSDEDCKIVYYANGASDLKELSFVLDKMSVDNHEAITDMEFIDAIKSDKFDYFLVDASAYEKIKSSINEVISNWSKLVVLSTCNYSYAGEPFEYVITKPVSCLNIADLINHTINYTVRKQSYEGDFTTPDSTILVIDDNLVNLDVASNLLSRYGCNVVLAASGREGIITLESEKIDLVFLDYMMPDMDGIDTLKQIRKLPDESQSKVPVVCLTANVVSGAKEMFLKEGFDDYLSKPIEIDKLSRVLLDYLPKDKIVFKI